MVVGMHGGGTCLAGGHARGVCMVGLYLAGGMHGKGHVCQGACMVGGGMCGRGACMAGEMATAADGTYPTGMHSCFSFFLVFHLFRFCS